MANAVYGKRGSAITFLGSGGTYVVTLAGLAQNSARISAQADLDTGGAGVSRPSRYMWRAWAKPAGAVVLGDTLLDLYIATSDGTFQDGTGGTADAALAIDKPRNLQQIGSLTTDATTAAQMVASGIIELPERYVSIAFVNRLSTAVALSATASDHGFSLTPLYDEIQ